jgi:C-terminal processing protease CtpA/Prc
VPQPQPEGLDWFPIDASGLRIVRREDRLTRVRRIVPESHAANAGLQLEDVIISLDGTPAVDLSRFEVEERLSRAGTTVRLEVLRGDQPLTFNLPLSHPFEYPPKWDPKPEVDDEFLKTLDEP